ncbi:hypothetical protein P152DRAFT_401372 [Eremomyces bilateralis CBS 781.70]|uniref:Uncharacterized protein n=1 Tax=Eremomyces bilateralis CBS 781.70 TaxID=1392243 RepID=A0A6G1FX74_9PEZI|nr:uncharacterized protein P152DRAFT_401372 [Eremomyces bilateralis CBS 781.70]KAF1810495.1 hypothetical protein P152DRAFT_401372 [Eremomyces bilateralis CBS 781.70]
MLPSLQPRRPKQGSQHQNPSSRTNMFSSALGTKQPSSQIEAMPPYPSGHLVTVPHTASFPNHAGLRPSLKPPTMPITTPVFDSATRHPVFFTHNLRRPPFPMPAGSAAHPVSWGYIFDKKKPTSGHGGTML